MIPEEYFHMGFDGVILGAGTYVEYEGKILHQELMTPEEVQTVIDWGKKQKIGIILEGENMDIMIRRTQMIIILR